MTQFYRRCWRFVRMLVVLCLGPGVASATHIVGGELELRALGPGNTSTHRLTLNMYFDDINGNPAADDAVITVQFFRKRDNFLLGSLSLPRISSTLLDYAVPACARGDLRTRYIQYASDIILNPAQFADAGGYYIVWQRCCRNNTITNIQDPGGAGSAFYLEFPALLSGTFPQYNSSPRFRPIRGDYACLGQPFQFDFGATDPDGDSLSYSMVTPYNGYATRFITGQADRPVLAEGPYPPVNWAMGYTAGRSINGAQPLAVNPRTGLLTLVAGQTGLFVFSVEVLEWRKGAIIGRVRRDFQLRVVDCGRDSQPSLLLRAPGQTGFYKEGTVLTIQEKDLNCLSLLATDTQSNMRISLSNFGSVGTGGAAVPVTFGARDYVTRSTRDTLKTQVCFDRCAAGARGGPLELKLLLADEGCPQGQYDTLIVRLNVIPDQNRPPDVITSLVGNQSTVTVGQSLTFTATGTDPDRDPVIVQALGRGFDLASAGMTFAPVSGTATASGRFGWKPLCQQALRSEYVVDFVVTDTRCANGQRDTVTVRLRAEGLPSQPPLIGTNLPGNVVERTLDPSNPAGNQIDIIITGTDADRDTLRLTGQPLGTDWKRLGVDWADKTGLPTLQQALRWQPGCALLAGKDTATYRLRFAVTDRSCQPRNADTTTVLVKLRQEPADYGNVVVPNVFTPNGDGKNDTFSMPNLPADNCDDRLLDVTILNRWGREVYKTTDRRFRWDGASHPAGVYYFLARFTRRDYKGTVTLIR